MSRNQSVSDNEQREDRAFFDDAKHPIGAIGAASALDDAMEMQVFSIRLHNSQIENLKEIASYHGIGYQPMIRDLLDRFMRSEITPIQKERLVNLERHFQYEPERTPPVEAFMKRPKGS